MKKLMSLTLILVIMMTLITNVYAASSYKLSLKSSKRELNKGDEFSVDVKLSNIQDEKGIIALGATLEYDEDSLELVKMEGKGEWSKPTYNETNGKFVTDRNEYTTSDETICTITFKVKEESKQNLEIILSKISASNGEADMTIDDISTIVSIKNNDIITDPDNKKDEPFISENTNNENATSNNVTNNNQSASEKDMPNTGSSDIIVVFIVIATLATAVTFIKMQKVNKEM